MNRFLRVAMVSSLTACSTVYTRPEDAGVDAGVDADQDAITVDAAPDAWVVPDAFTPDSSEPDALNLPAEVCNGVDDDFDTTVDETLLLHGDTMLLRRGKKHWHVARWQ